MSVEQPPIVRTRAPRWMIVTLIISLAANLIVVGGALGVMWHFKRIHPYKDAGMPPYFGVFVSRLPKEKRDRIKALLRAQHARIDPLRKEARQARNAAIAEIGNEPLDLEKFNTLYQTYNETRHRLRQTRADVMPEILRLLTLEERKELLRMRKYRRRWRHHRPPEDR